jgi:DNA-binding MarR family transcriptional regulator
MVHAMSLRFDPISEARRNWEHAGWGAVDAMAAATSITRAHQILLGRINAVLGPLGLNFSRFEALALLRFSRKQELPLGKIGERLQVHPTSVTNTIDRLERDGLVKRVAHPTDGRATLARLTPEGRDRVEAAQDALAEIEFGFSGLDERALNRLDTDIKQLRRQAGDF